MNRVKKFGLFVVLCCLFFPSLSIAQKSPAIDSSKVKEDTLKVYHDIEKFAAKRKWTHEIFRSIFNLPKGGKKVEEKKRQTTYKQYSNRIIRNISIETLDPFGYSVYDASKVPSTFIDKTGNTLHVKTYPFILRNQLLFKKGDQLDPLRIKESERLIRQSAYVKDVLFEVLPINNNSDSVDIIIHEQDLWTIGGGVGLTSGHSTISLSDRNFFGIANETDNTVTRDFANNRWHYNGSYSIPYYKTTFISITGTFNFDGYQYQRGLSIDREFYSPLASWAGGINVAGSRSKDAIMVADTTFVSQTNTLITRDYWAGWSIPLLPGKTEELRSTRLIFTSNYKQLRYQSPPVLLPDGNLAYNNSQLILAGVGYSNRTYYRDQYIYHYGLPEDVPAGRLVNFIFGYEKQKFLEHRFYYGIMGGVGDHLDNFGYIDVRLGYGTFIRRGRAEQGAINSDVGYFTDLLSLQRWHVRQFARVRWVMGLDRSLNEALTINDTNGLKGFSSNVTLGNSKCVINLQTVAYSPYSLLGFRFAPIIFLGFGALGTTTRPLLKSRIYQSYGIGLMITNELLVIRTFQVTAALFPYIPGNGPSVLKFNPVKTTDLTFRDFGISKPEPIVFQ